MRRALLAGLCCLAFAAAGEAQAGGSAGGKEKPGIPGLQAGKPKPKDKEKQPAPAAKPAQEKEPAKPDPRKQADLVTRDADQRAEQEIQEEQSVREHFRMCDLDGNQWISLREGSLTLALSRDEYLRADQNRDGRLDEAEFLGEKQLVLARLGARGPARRPAEEPSVAAEPEAAPAATEEPGPPVPTPEESGPRATLAPEEPREDAPSEVPSPAHLAQVLERFDADRSQGLDASELGRFLQEVGLSLSAELIVEQLDPDDSGQVETSDLGPIAWLARRDGQAEWPWVEKHVELAPAEPVADPVGPAPSAAAPPSVPLPTDSPPSTPPSASVPYPPAPSPAAILSPTWTHFGRLDADQNGYIEVPDLRALQSPARLDLRFPAVLSAMDRDGDGRLSATEFRRSMSVPPR